jgi:chromatin structure-remodeling complex subunit RSC1/2
VNTYQDHRSTEVFTLPDTANASIPKHIRDKFPQDDLGRVLFFTKPPIVHDWTVRGKDGQVLKHTEKYLKAKEERERAREERKRSREEEKERLDGAKRARV